ncbi:ATP-binding protein [Paenibacillus xanthanilyticus]|uniref:histidine kinase n=1 Tax=Paenibacillus xanthanilyticus TaxID=1783531 RepID=A0ABV8K0G7_9BACL
MTPEIVIQRMFDRQLRSGSDPSRVPEFPERLQGEQLTAKKAAYQEVIDVVAEFIHKFLASVAGHPMMVAMQDEQGYTLRVMGDPTILSMLRTLGVGEGCRFTEDNGPSTALVCAQTRRPVEMKGKEHFHEVLHAMACYSVPVLEEEGGRLLAVLTVMTSLEEAHRHMLAMLSTVADSIERELRLRRQNMQLRILNQVLLDTQYYGLLITDPEGRIVDRNSHMAALLDEAGVKAPLGASVLEVPELGGYFADVIRTGESCVGKEMTLQTPVETRAYMLDVVPIYEGGRRLDRVVGSLRDITELKKTEEVLRNTEKLVFAGQLAVGIAHEVRNPLTTVKGLLQYGNRGEKQPHYDLIMSELERMNLIVSEFMILGKPQAAKFREEECRLILSEILRIFDIQASMNGIAVSLESSESASILCDRNQIKQVFLNILRNAMDALPFGGQIAIRLDVAEGYQRVRFADNGHGMSEDVLKDIGKPFHTTKPEGNGLGLMIVRKIIAAHEGRLAIRSEVGEGTVVDVYLPIVREGDS